MPQGSAHHEHVTNVNTNPGTTRMSTTPAPQHIVDKVSEKQVELRQLEQIANHSEQVAKQLESLSKHFKSLSNDAKKVDKAFTNWHTVFRTMGMLTDDTLNKGHPTIVKLPIHDGEEDKKQQ
ncbi:predicted protein [Lichtheimia corymbifera JMRC:FSU:9682]|uniref:DASH complex subunit DAD2 n=1 Tax=Lichtheimia corymbifera JMRC:FSU:9682 TaxID=1263082 RepID=A0A068RUB6_9FUNG|nr:predicted protein [Lichtheimia corymbifera JMRC:FSU:9682]